MTTCESWIQEHENAGDDLRLLRGREGDGVYMIQPMSKQAVSRTPYDRGVAIFYLWIDGKLVREMRHTTRPVAEITWRNLKDNPKRAIQREESE